MNVKAGLRSGNLERGGSEPVQGGNAAKNLHDAGQRAVNAHTARYGAVHCDASATFRKTAGNS